jgi:signal transduction histidine kinase/ActR/RegA family two-component response regulator
MSEGTFIRHDVPGQYLNKWQRTVDLAVELFGADAVLIRSGEGNGSEIIVASQNAQNPFPRGRRDPLGRGCYSESVMLGRVMLNIADAREEAPWRERLAANDGMVAYLGVPLIWPDRSMFGTLEVLRRQPMILQPTLEKLLGQFKELIEGDFRIIHYLRALDRRKGELEELVMERTAELRQANEKLQSELQERQHMEEVLLQSKKLESIGRLAGGVAHDFNNMLQTILGYSEIAMDEVAPDSRIGGCLKEIQMAGQRSADLTRQLLAFARKQTIDPKILDLNDAVAGMLKMLERIIGEDIDLLWKPASNLGRVKMDPSQIDSILANLCVNARDAIAGVGKVTIETENVEFNEGYCANHPGFIPGRFVMLALSDDGCGMDKATQERIFEPFFTTKELGKGTGLGMATVYGIVQQNYGFINVYSEPGKGTTFRIYLPRLAGEDAPREEDREVVERKTGTETVLLVEDEASLLVLATKIVQDLGYTVLAADRPSTAIQMLREYSGEIHLLMTDVVMPEMNGRDLWRDLVALRPGLKCLFVSGYTADAIAHRGVLDDGVNFLHKPFSVHDLAAKLREVLDG